MAIKEHDFVEIEYTGRFAEDKTVFDTSDEALAKQSGIYTEGMRYGPITICIGEHQVIRGLDKNLVGKEAGKDYTFTIPPEDGFGKKDTKLLMLVPANTFKKQNINVMPGLQVEIDGRMGTIRTAAGGRVIVDFNHPFSGKDLIYEVKVRRMVEDKAEQIGSLLYLLMGTKPDVSVAQGAATVTLEQKFPPELEKELEKKVVGLTGITSVTFNAKAGKEPAGDKPAEDKALPKQE